MIIANDRIVVVVVVVFVVVTLYVIIVCRRGREGGKVSVTSSPQSFP